MILINEFSGSKAAVLGLGRTGISVLNSLNNSGVDTVCWDDNLDARQQAKELGFNVENILHGSNWAEFDLLIISPGISFLYPKPHDVVKKARQNNVRIDNDIGLFFSSIDKNYWEKFEKEPRIIGVTGSNGKSTTSFLISHLIERAGIPSEIGGNFGKPVLSFNPFKDGEVKIIELSSYQTEVASTLKCDISVFLNFSPDHLDRHGGAGGYFNAKQRLFTIGNSERNIICVDNKEGEFLFNSLETDELARGSNIAIASKRNISNYGWSVFINKGFLVEWKNRKQVASFDLKPRLSFLRSFNLQNICAAYAVARSLNISPKAIWESLDSFEGLTHRNQLVLEKDGVKYVNDSKATNVEAALNSILQYDSVRLILGGLAKKGGISKLTMHMNQVKKIYLIGDAAKDFSSELKGNVEYEISKTLEEAVNSATNDSVAGDCILLAPACASFDQFKDFEERGKKFISLVENIKN
tara:strand:+ start:1395 stop:2801 length:1407 start_codon:yes stop_codon:yes gene_type:complete